ncbi:MAG: hypothetical protein SGI92_07280 [Bryobacteraceae bacterium]|nr:hypothetical protein [Bryobacteraceae bacterium]
MLTELPSSSRSVLKFPEMAPGVNITSNDSQVMNIQGAGATVNGNRSGRNVFYLDGSDNTASFRNSALQFPNPDAVHEVNIGTSNTSAEFGNDVEHAARLFAGGPQRRRLHRAFSRYSPLALA